MCANMHTHAQTSLSAASILTILFKILKCYNYVSFQIIHHHHTEEQRTISKNCFHPEQANKTFYNWN